MTNCVSEKFWHSQIPMSNGRIWYHPENSQYDAESDLVVLGHSRKDAQKSPPYHGEGRTNGCSNCFSVDSPPPTTGRGRTNGCSNCFSVDSPPPTTGRGRTNGCSNCFSVDSPPPYHREGENQWLLQPLLGGQPPPTGWVSSSPTPTKLGCHVVFSKNSAVAQFCKMVINGGNLLKWLGWGKMTHIFSKGNPVTQNSDKQCCYEVSLFFVSWNLGRRVQ